MTLKSIEVVRDLLGRYNGVESILWDLAEKAAKTHDVKRGRSLLQAVEEIRGLTELSAKLIEPLLEQMQKLENAVAALNQVDQEAIERFLSSRFPGTQPTPPATREESREEVAPVAEPTAEEMDKAREAARELVRGGMRDTDKIIDDVFLRTGVMLTRRQVGTQVSNYKRWHPEER